MNSSNDSEGADSAIFQAVLTHSSDVVKTVIDSRLTNRALVKAAFNLALKRRLDEILGLLLKALGLDRNKGSLNIGGLGLRVIKPLWLYPSLGVSNTSRYRTHRRVGSLDYVLSGLIRRSSTGVSPDKEQLEKGGANTEDRASGEGVASEGGAALSESVGVAPVRPSEAEDVHKFIKSWDASRFDDYYTLSAPPPSRFLQKRLKMVASRPPSLPTVVCSPVAAVKEKPLENSPTDNLLLSGNDRFVGSYLEGTSEMEVSNGVSKDEVDGDRRDSIASRDEDASGRVPQRRHANVTKTMTGASYMPFSTLDLFHQQGLTNLPHSSGSRSSKMSANSADTDIFSPGHVRRAVLKNQLLKRKSTPPPGGFSSSQSRSTSPYLSSDEVALGGGGGRVTYSALLDSITTTPREKRTELLSSLISSNEEEVDEPDGGGTPGAPPIATVAMTTPFSTATPSRLSSTFFIKSLDISANQLETVETLVNDPLPSRLRELLYVDMKQNKLTELPQLLFQVSVMYNTVVIAW